MPTIDEPTVASVTFVLERRKDVTSKLKILKALKHQAVSTTVVTVNAPTNKISFGTKLPNVPMCLADRLTTDAASGTRWRADTSDTSDLCINNLTRTDHFIHYPINCSMVDGQVHPNRSVCFGKIY